MAGHRLVCVAAATVTVATDGHGGMRGIARGTAQAGCVVGASRAT
jgi:hypothetical protein